MGFVASGGDTPPVLELVEQPFDEVVPTVLFPVMGCWGAFGGDHTEAKA